MDDVKKGNVVANGKAKPKMSSAKKRAAAEALGDSADEIENYESSDFDSDNEEAEEVSLPVKKGVKRQAAAVVEHSDGEEEEDESEGDEIDEEDDDDDAESEDEDGEIGLDDEMEIDEDDDDDDDQEEDDDEDAEDDEEIDDQLKIQSLADFSGDETSDSDNSDDEPEEEDLNGEDDDDLLPIEKANKRLRIKKEKDAQLAVDEQKMSEEHHEVFQFPDETNEEEADKVVTLQDIQQRIKDVMLVLGEFNKYRQEGRSRPEYMELLRKDLCLYYSYNEFLMEKLMDIFPLNELMEYLEASEVQRPITIRTNSLKTRRRDLAAALISRGVNLDPLGKWTKVGLVVYSATVPLGATPEYLAGHYMIQGASSMLPVMALAPQENERILDMCAAPGGKSSHIAAIMKNTGVLFSNDANRDRIKAVVGNFHRLGVVNSVVSHEDGCKFANIMTGFDRILLDAPCTGTGVVAKDPSVKTTKTDTDIQRCYNLQRKLLLSAIDCLSAKSTTGGYLVYSTCSILPEENEWVVDYALKTRNVKLVPTGLDFGTEGFVNYRQFRFHPSMKHTRRYYPHTHNMDGFFVAKFKKFSDVIPANGNAVEEDDELNVETAQNGTAADGDANEETAVPVKPKITAEDLAAKKKQREKDAKNYVAKVFEAAPKAKKIKLDDDALAQKKTKKSKVFNGKQVQSNESKKGVPSAGVVPAAKSTINPPKKAVAPVASEKTTKKSAKVQSVPSKKASAEKVAPIVKNDTTSTKVQSIPSKKSSAEKVAPIAKNITKPAPAPISPKDKKKNQKKAKAATEAASPKQRKEPIPENTKPKNGKKQKQPPTQSPASSSPVAKPVPAKVANKAKQTAPVSKLTAVPTKPTAKVLPQQKPTAKPQAAQSAQSPSATSTQPQKKKSAKKGVPATNGTPIATQKQQQQQPKKAHNNKNKKQ